MVLAAALARKRHWWLGPVQIPLDDLVRLAGPERDVLVPIAPDEWEGDVAEMGESLDHGWEPPPLLAEYQDGRLLLQDGNHRYEALARANERAAWVLVYFDDPAERDVFVAAQRSKAASPMIGAAGGWSASEPRKGELEKSNTPPSDAASK